MTVCAPPADASLYLLSEHLDAVLAIGEDLLTEKVALAEATQRMTTARAIRQSREVRFFLESLRTLELTMTARLLQARKRAEEIKSRGGSRLKPLIALFVSGTSALADGAADLGDPSSKAFDTGDTALAFLRSRGLIAADAAGLEGLSRLAVSEDYLVAGRVRLGTVLDLVATFLDTLDRMFDVFGDRASPEAAKSVGGAS
jgi:hypothetical protein